MGRFEGDDNGQLPGKGRNMPDELTDDQIALLCEIGEFHLPESTGDQERNLERLISSGYIGPAENDARTPFLLTSKGIDFLGKRGAGLNEG